MSLLVDKQIKKLIESGEIKISPYDENKVSAGTYKLSLGKVILIPEPGQRVELGSRVNPNYERVEIPKDGFVLKPGMFVLGQTKEKITIPNYIGGFFDSRSTLARLGVSVHNTSMFIEPGHTNSIITMEMFNEGDFDVVLKEGVAVAKLIFISSSESADRGYSQYGRYAVQKETTGASVD
jgi:dCTP deaminase